MGESKSQNDPADMVLSASTGLDEKDGDVRYAVASPFSRCASLREASLCAAACAEPALQFNFHVAGEIRVPAYFFF